MLTKIICLVVCRILPKHKERNSEPDIDTFPLSNTEIEKTKLLLCSDGFSGSVSEEECSAIALDGSLSVEEKVDKLIELAKKNNGSDNITLIMAELG